jgi:hypothetical protein
MHRYVASTGGQRSPYIPQKMNIPLLRFGVTPIFLGLLGFFERRFADDPSSLKHDESG